VVPDGHVSEWVWSHAQVGDIVGLSQAQGQFTLPHALPRQLLFVSGGSGITPLMSMMRHLAHVRYSGRVHWVHYARHEVIFSDELAQLTASEPRLKLHLHVARRGEAASLGRNFSELQLQRDVPQWRQCETFVCGPTRLMDAVRAHWQRHQVEDRLHEEFFRLQPRFALDESAADADCELSFQRSGVRWSGQPANTLLDQAEAAGLTPSSGCRMGICHSCVCRKVSGVVRNEITGQLSSEPDEEIQLCISTPRSNVVLDL
jgi:ferredoxin-NADP reductase